MKISKALLLPVLLTMGTLLFSGEKGSHDLNGDHKEEGKKPTGFYVGTDIGYNIVFNIHSIRQLGAPGGTSINYRGRGSFVYAFNAGYQWSNYRAEVLGSLLNSQVDFNDVLSYLRDWTIMARGLYDFDIPVSGLAPYLGFQMGAYVNDPDTIIPKQGAYAPIKSGSAFAYGSVIGLRYNMVEGLYIHGEWNGVTTLDINNGRFTYNVTANTFLGGLKYKF